MNLESRIITQAKLGTRTLEKIEIEDKILLITYRSKYSLDGYVYDKDGTNESDFKLLKIQESKNGEYVMAEMRKFPLSKIETVKYDRKKLKKELESAKLLKAVFEKMKAEGNDVGYNIENYQFFIENLEKILLELNMAGA